MPMPSLRIKKHQPIRDQALPIAQSNIQFDPLIAGAAVVDGLLYLKERLQWSGTKIAHVLHLPANTLNSWLKKGAAPIHHALLSPDLQAVIHLLAIHRSLEALFDDPTHQRDWLITFNTTLNIVPEQLMGASIDGLILVRQYLDYVRGRGA